MCAQQSGIAHLFMLISAAPNEADVGDGVEVFHCRQEGRAAAAAVVSPSAAEVGCAQGKLLAQRITNKTYLGRKPGHCPGRSLQRAP